MAGWAGEGLGWHSSHREAVGARQPRSFKRPPQRRTLELQPVLVPVPYPGRHRGLEDGVQSTPTALAPRLLVTRLGTNRSLTFSRKNAGSTGTPFVTDVHSVRTRLDKSRSPDDTKRAASQHGCSRRSGGTLAVHRLDSGQ
jgi:hypothetical protein